MNGTLNSASTDARLVLHIGPGKTGTTYLQRMLAQNRAELAEQGWAYPGPRLSHQLAIYGICGSDIYHRSDTRPYEALGQQLLAGLAAATAPRTLWSAEAMAQLDDGAVEGLLRKTGHPEKVVMTVRGLHALLPSLWQENLKKGHTETLPEFVDRFVEARGGPPSLGYAFGDVARRWSQHAPVHVVVLPSRGGRRDQLWQLFRKTVGISDVSDLTGGAREANVSLSAEAAEVLRQLNVALGRRGKRRAKRLRQHYLLQAAFPLADTDGGTRIVLPPEAHDRVRRWNEEELDEVVRFATVVHGDLSDAAFQARPVPHTDSVTTAAVTARHLAALLAADVGDKSGYQHSAATSAVR